MRSSWYTGDFGNWTASPRCGRDLVSFDSIFAFLAALRVFFRSRSDIALDLLALRQQVAALKRFLRGRLCASWRLFDHTIQHVLRNPLDARIHAERSGKCARRDVTGRRRQPFGPPDGSCIENPIALAAGIHYRRMNLGLFHVVFCRWREKGAACHDFQSLDIGERRPVMLPTDDAWDTVARLQAGAFVSPVLRLGYYPISISGAIRGRSHQRLLIREPYLPRHRTAGCARQRAVIENDFPRNGVAGEECDAQALIAGCDSVFKHSARPVLVVPHRLKRLRHAQDAGVEIEIDIRAI